MDEKKAIIDKILEEVESGDKNDLVIPLYEQFGFLIARDISKAISPVNEATAPITIAYLEGYAKELRRKFPDSIPLAEEFKKAAGVTGIVLTKLDGTAKGGIVISIRRELNIPVKFIGVGEKLDDMQEFDQAEFVKALFE